MYDEPTLIVIGKIKNNIKINPLFHPTNDCSGPNVYPSDKTIIERNNLTQSNILIGNVILHNKYHKEETLFGIHLLDAIYSDMSGRLFSALREKYNLVYRVGVEFSFYNNGDILWQVSAGLDQDKIDLARELVIKELSRPVSKKDLETALIKAIGSQEMAMDNVVNIGNTIAYSLIRGNDYQDLIFNYKKGLTKATKIVNDLIKMMNFKDNIVACCKYCNIAKSDLTQTKFFNHIKKIYEYIKQK
jgi:predicted Zn-dependent peptidase